MLRLSGWIRPLLTTAMLLRLVPITVVLLVGIVLSVWTHDLLSAHQERVVHTYQVIDATKDLLIDLDDAETGQRGFLLSGDPRYLQPYARALHRQDDMTARLATLIRDDPDQVARVKGLVALIQRKMDELHGAIAAREVQGEAAGVAAVLASTDRATMDAIRRQIGQITHAEMALLATRAAEVSHDEHRAQLIALLVGLASILTRVGVEMVLAKRTRAAPAALT